MTTIRNEYTLNVDLKRKYTAIVPTFVQHDSATLIFKIFNDGIYYDLSGFTSAQVTTKRRDSEVVIGIATIEGEVGNQFVKYEYLGNEMDVSGFAETTLTLFSEGTRVSILPFKVHIVADLRDALGASESHGLLQDLIVQIEAVSADSVIQRDYAKAQGDYAKAQGDYATTKGNDAYNYAKTETDEIVAYAKQETDDAVAYSNQVANDNKNILLSPVANFSAIATTYTTPQLGMKVQTLDNGKFYRYQNNTWTHVETADTSVIGDISSQLIKTGTTAPQGQAVFWLDLSVE